MAPSALATTSVGAWPVAYRRSPSGVVSAPVASSRSKRWAWFDAAITTTNRCRPARGGPSAAIRVGSAPPTIHVARGGNAAVRSPVGGLLVIGPWLVVTHIGRGTGFPPAEGLDGDGDGAPGDGTGNVMFQDLQNELSVYAIADRAPVGTVTSDTLCCHDYRDVDPDHPDRGTAIPAPESWPPERTSMRPSGVASAASSSTAWPVTAPTQTWPAASTAS